MFKQTRHPAPLLQITRGVEKGQKLGKEGRWSDLIINGTQQLAKSLEREGDRLLHSVDTSGASLTHSDVLHASRNGLISWMDSAITNLPIRSPFFLKECAGSA